MNKRKFMKITSSILLTVIMVSVIAGSASAFVIVIPKIFEDVNILNWAAT